MDAPKLTGKDGGFYLAHDEPLVERMQEALQYGDIVLHMQDGAFHVTSSGGQEFGNGPDLETALRYCLGAFYA